MVRLQRNIRACWSAKFSLNLSIGFGAINGGSISDLKGQSYTNLNFIVFSWVNFKIIIMKSFPLSLRYAMMIYAGLVAYFFIMKILGLEEITELRLFNFFIVLAGLYRLIRESKMNGESGYLQNLFLGFRTSAIAILFTGISLNIYVSVIDPSFMTVLSHSLAWGNNLTVQQATLGILIEGIASSFLMAYMIMQYMKNWVPDSDLKVSKTPS